MVTSCVWWPLSTSKVPPFWTCRDVTFTSRGRLPKPTLASLPRVTEPPWYTYRSWMPETYKKIYILRICCYFSHVPQSTMDIHCWSVHVTENMKLFFYISSDPKQTFSTIYRRPSNINEKTFSWAWEKHITFKCNLHCPRHFRLYILDNTKEKTTVWVSIHQSKQDWKFHGLPFQEMKGRSVWKRYVEDMSHESFHKQADWMECQL